jgi:hypothetical protein
MDEFARMMSMEGVRPLDYLKEKSRRPVKQPPPVPSQALVTPPELGQVATHGLQDLVRALRLRRRWSDLPTRSAMDGVAGQPASFRMAGRSHCLLRQERHHCLAPQIANRCA